MTPASRAAALLNYDANTGLFTWSVNRKGRGAKAGALAGYSRPDGYVSIKIDGCKEYAHRIAWVMTRGPIPSGMEVDHIDHNPSNNRISNLRLVTKQGNRMNCSVGRRNKSGVIGVHWSSNANKWCAQIRKDRKTQYLGYFSTVGEAMLVRAKAEAALGFHANHGRKTS